MSCCSLRRGSPTPRGRTAWGSCPGGSQHVLHRAAPLGVGSPGRRTGPTDLDSLARKFPRNRDRRRSGVGDAERAVEEEAAGRGHHLDATASRVVRGEEVVADGHAEREQAAGLDLVGSEQKVPIASRSSCMQRLSTRRRRSTTVWSRRAQPRTARSMGKRPGPNGGVRGPATTMRPSGSVLARRTRSLLGRPRARALAGSGDRAPPSDLVAVDVRSRP